jgi:glycosyltransferase involved in cell wall biosynthesis
MRIAIVNTLYYPSLFGGAERSVQQVAEGLAMRGHEVTVLTTPVDGVARRYEHRGVQVVALPIRNAYHPYAGEQPPGAARRLLWHLRDISNAAMADAVHEVLREIRPDVLSSHALAGFSAAVWNAAARLGLPIAHTLRDYYLLCPRSAMYDHRRGAPCTGRCTSCRGFSAPRSAMTQRVQAVIGISDFILQRHLRYGLFAGAALTQVIANAYEAPAPPDIAPAARPFRFGFVGQLIAEKGIDTLLRAFMRLPAQRASLHIFGRGDPGEVAALTAIAGRHPGVVWEGYRPADEAMRSIDALVVPSRWDEPFGRVLIEAFSHAVPVIGARRGGIPEVLSAPDCGVLFDPLQVETLAQAMTWMLDQVPERYLDMRRAAQARARSFSVSRMIESYEALFDALGVPQGAAVAEAPA